jgi:phosphoribulokinase
MLIGVVGDSGSGKTTLSAAIAECLGPDTVTSICLDDYHRYDRAERARLDITALAPQCNRLDLMLEHLSALKRGTPIVKPVYNHTHGTFDPDERLVPKSVIIARGLLALHTPELRSIFDLSVFLDPDPALRMQWKVARDTAKRSYTAEEVMRHLRRRLPDVERYIAPQRAHADVVIMYSASSDGTLALRVAGRQIGDGMADAADPCADPASGSCLRAVLLAAARCQAVSAVSVPVEAR